MKKFLIFVIVISAFKFAINADITKQYISDTFTPIVKDQR